MSWDKEAIYDEKIAPLMGQIIAICKEHDMPMVAQFQYADTEENGPAYCTTSLPIKGFASDHIREMGHRLQPPRPVVLAEMHVTNPDGSKTITIRDMSR
jgi:hypothetical protein